MVDTAQVLPSLRDLRDETLLRELHKRWQNHNVMIRWLSRFFNYLDRCHAASQAFSRHCSRQLCGRAKSIIFARC